MPCTYFPNQTNAKKDKGENLLHHFVRQNFKTPSEASSIYGRPRGSEEGFTPNILELH